MIYRLATLCALLLLTACDSGNKEKTAPPKLFASQIEALDKAKMVDDSQQKKDAEQRKAIEQQTQ